jgi:acetolactate synthase-like protein
VIVCAGATAIILKGRGSLQDIDQFALMKPHVKKMFSIQAVRQIIPAIREAFIVAQEGVPGPVFIEFPIETLWPRALTEMQIGAGSKPPPLEFNAKSLMAHAARLYIQRHVNNVFKDAFVPAPPVSSTVPLPQQPLSSQIEIVARVCILHSLSPFNLFFVGLHRR